MLDGRICYCWNRCWKARRPDLAGKFARMGAGKLGGPNKKVHSPSLLLGFSRSPWNPKSHFDNKFLDRQVMLWSLYPKCLCIKLNIDCHALLNHTKFDRIRVAPFPRSFIIIFTPFTIKQRKHRLNVIPASLYEGYVFQRIRHDPFEKTFKKGG